MIMLVTLGEVETNVSHALPTPRRYQNVKKDVKVFHALSPSRLAILLQTTFIN